MLCCLWSQFSLCLILLENILLQAFPLLKSLFWKSKGISLNQLRQSLHALQLWRDGRTYLPCAGSPNTLSGGFNLIQSTEAPKLASWLSSLIKGNILKSFHEWFTDISQCPLCLQWHSQKQMYLKNVPQLPEATSINICFFFWLVLSLVRSPYPWILEDFSPFSHNLLLSYSSLHHFPPKLHDFCSIISMPLNPSYHSKPFTWGDCVIVGHH